MALWELALLLSSGMGRYFDLFGRSMLDKSKYPTPNMTIRCRVPMGNVSWMLFPGGGGARTVVKIWL